jgi:RHS repeat-associated protein
LQNDTVYTPFGSCDSHIKQTQYYSGTGSNRTLLKTVATTFESLSDPYTDDMDILSAPRLPLNTVTTLPNGQVNDLSKVSYTYDSGFTFTDTNLYGDPGNFTGLYGLVQSESHTDWNTGSPGPVLSTTNTNYLYSSNSNYVTANILDLPSSVIITDGSGNKCAETDYGYDESNADSSGVSEQHVSAPFSVRGNLTSIKRQLFTSPCSTATPSMTPLTTTNHVFDTGTIHTVTDPKNNPPTTYSYSGTYYGAYPTSVCNPLNQCTIYGYDFNTGLMTSLKDPNNQSTSFQYDNMLRPILANYPDTGQTTIAYNYSGNVFVGDTVTKLATPDPNIVTTQLFDGLGRLKETQLTSDPAGTDYTDITYDPDGRKYKVWNPTRCYPVQTNNCESPWGYTTYNYDPLNRVTSVVEQDGSTVSTNYASFPCTTVTDEAGKTRKSCADGAGRMTGVWEDPNALNYQTSYAYDALDNLLSVTQSSSRQRTFSYDSLSRLTRATNPESGTANYTYDATGNLITKTSPAPNQIGSNTVTTTYTYDALNRLTQKSYNDGTTRVAGFYYDSRSPANFTNAIGRLVTTWDGVSEGNIYNYDPMGRVTSDLSCVEITGCWMESTTKYAYDLLGDITSYMNTIEPYNGGATSSITFNQTFDSAGRPTQLTSSLADGQHPGTLAKVDPSVGYYPNGAIRKMTLGNGLIESAVYQSRLQPCRITLYSSGTAPAGCGDASPSGNIQDFEYVYGTGTTNNGNITGWTGIGTQAFSRTYGYDNLNRLSSLSDTSLNPCPGLSWNYDAWGNRTNQNVTSGSCGSSQLTINAQNQITNAGIQYDAAGNMTNDGSHSYTYDAENRLIKVDGGTTASYLYDPSGRRVSKTTGGTTTSYVHDLADNVLFETQGTTQTASWVTGYNYFAGALVAQYKNGTTSFVHKDHLGSTRLVTGVGQTQAPNGGFEQGLNGWSSSVLSGGAVQITNNPANAHSGNYYVDLSAPAGGYAYLANSNIPVNPGDQITFGGWVYLESGGSSWQPGWWLGARDTNHQAINWIAPSPPGSSGWTYQSGTYTVPSGVAYVWLYATVYQNTSTTAMRVDDGFFYIARTNLTVVDSMDYLPFGEQIAGAPAGYTYCANEGQTCTFGGTMTVAFGAYGSFYIKTGVVGSISCNDATFGDPLIGIVKACYVNYGSNTTTHKITGKERDGTILTETGLDYFGARYDSSQYGRFMTSDPSGLYYADPANPQSLNLYSYVRNNPLSFIDPTGEECVWDDGSYDSNTDHETGRSDQCSQAGGTYFNHAYFNAPNGDWSDQANTGLANAAWLSQQADRGACPSGTICSNPYGDGGNTWFMPSPAFDTSSATNEDYIKAIHDQLTNFPEVCSVGVTARAGVGKVSLGADLNSNDGLNFATRSALPPIGPFTVAASTRGSNLSTSVSARIPDTPFSVGASSRDGFKTISSVNVGTRLGKYGNAQAYANLGQSYSCKK